MLRVHLFCDECRAGAPQSLPRRPGIPVASQHGPPGSRKDRADAQEAVASATKQREKEAAEFASESTEDKANIAACSKAIDAIVKGMAGSFLQSDAASALRNLVPQQFGFRQCTGDVQKWKFVAWRCGAVIALPICRLQLFFGVSFGMLYRICGCSTFCEENPKVSRIERS